eukprot:2831553-Pleurochrysis_carterae.AAC.4
MGSSKRPSSPCPLITACHARSPLTGAWFDPFSRVVYLCNGLRVHIPDRFVATGFKKVTFMMNGIKGVAADCRIAEIKKSERLPRSESTSTNVGGAKDSALAIKQEENRQCSSALHDKMFRCSEYSSSPRSSSHVVEQRKAKAPSPSCQNTNSKIASRGNKGNSNTDSKG